MSPVLLLPSARCLAHALGRAMRSCGYAALMICAACSVEVPQTLPAVSESPTTATLAEAAQLSPSEAAATFEPGADNGWGPLAVAHDDGRMFAGAAGTLRITDSCTYLLDRDEQIAYVLVWRAADTIWDAERRRIIFRNPEYRDPPSQIFALGRRPAHSVGRRHCSVRHANRPEPAVGVGASPGVHGARVLVRGRDRSVSHDQRHADGLVVTIHRNRDRIVAADGVSPDWWPLITGLRV